MSTPKPSLSIQSLFTLVQGIQKDIRTLYKRSNANSFSMVAEADDVAVAATTSATEVIDSAVGTISFYVNDADDWYKIRYRARVQSDAAPATIDMRIRDGGASTPTNTSTLVAGASCQVQATSGAGATTLVAEEIVQFAVGQHTLAGFYVRTTGSGNVLVGQSTGSRRQLTAEHIG